MATLLYLRDETLADPIVTWDEIEEAIAAVEEKINAVDAEFVYTPFVPDTRSATWVMTKTEIQGLEDRLHTIALYLSIPHIQTVWSGLMPINYNALNHILYALAPQAAIDAGMDYTGELEEIMPEGYDPTIYDIHYIEKGGGGQPDPTKLEELILNHYTYYPVNVAFDPGHSSGNYLSFLIAFAAEISLEELSPIANFWFVYYDSNGYIYHYAEQETRLVEIYVDLEFGFQFLMVQVEGNVYPATVDIHYDGGALIYDVASGNRIPAFVFTKGLPV